MCTLLLIIFYFIQSVVSFRFQLMNTTTNNNYNTKDIHKLTHSNDFKAFKEFVFCCLILFFVVICYIG